MSLLNPASRTRRSAAADGPPDSPAPKPPLKWAGGKRWLIPVLRPLWERHSRRRLVEPFCGGLGLALSVRPRRALLNDINPHAINFYRWLKRELTVSVPMRYDERLYYEHRRRFNDLVARGEADSREAAELFYFLNRTGYNGLCRFNRGGGFNVPFGKYARVNYATDFSPYARAFANWTFTAGDFERVRLRPDDFIYADPPYDVQFTQYSKEGFSWDDQVRLAGWLAAHPGPVVLSNQATPRVVRLYRSLGFKLTFHDRLRLISCQSKRPSDREVLATKGV